jgi:hypothetical protein
MFYLAMKRFTITNSLIDLVSDAEMDAESFCPPGGSNGLYVNTIRTVSSEPLHRLFRNETIGQ